jgi:xanthosine utilization system XapX-like protein
MTTVRYIAGSAIALVVIVMLTVIGLSIVHGVRPDAPSVVGLLAFVGTLIGLLANLFSTQTVAVAVQTVGTQLTDVQEKVNGHLAAHIGHTDEQVRSLVDQRLDERLPPASGPGAPAPG